MPGQANTALGNLSNNFMFLVPNTNVTNVGANTSVERTYTVPGLRFGLDVTTVSKPSFQAGLTIAASRVSADNTLAVTFVNNTGGAIAPAAETYLLQVDRAGYDSQAQIPTGL